MKTIITLFILSLPVIGYSQRFEVSEKYVKIIATNGITVNKAFEASDIALPIVQKVLNRFVEKDGHLYYRAGIKLFRSPRIYRIENMKAFDKINNAGLFTIGRLERKGLISRETI